MHSDSPQPEGTPDPDKLPENASPVFTQPFQNQPVAARVPQHASRGVFTTGVLVQEGPHEFVLDFLQGLSRPFQVGARVILAPMVMDATVRTLAENLNKFVQAFGAPQPLPRPLQQRRPTIQEIYENFKLPEELWSGAYANAVMIGHGPSEFFIDFITGFFPTAAVSCRVYFAAQQAPRLLETMRTSLQQHQQRRAAAGGAGGHAAPPATPQQQQPPPESLPE